VTNGRKKKFSGWSKRVANGEKYYADGYSGYRNVVFPGVHVRNCRDKSDTHNVESVNADLRHFIPVLARRSRCFSRKIEILQAIVKVFTAAYNLFGIAKEKCKKLVNHKPTTKNKHLHKFRESPFSIYDFL
jgi:IS1 family transposase